MANPKGDKRQEPANNAKNTDGLPEGRKPKTEQKSQHKQGHKKRRRKRGLSILRSFKKPQEDSTGSSSTKRSSPLIYQEPSTRSKSSASPEKQESPQSQRKKAVANYRKMKLDEMRKQQPARRKRERRSLIKGFGKRIADRV